MLKVFKNGLLDSNAYLFGDDKECALIDAGVPTSVIQSFVDENNLKLTKIILTHMHFDHVAYSFEISKLFNAEIYIHSFDAEGLLEPAQNLSSFMGVKTELKAPDEVVLDGDAIKIGDVQLKVIHTPGHTAGGICLFYDKVLFTGDTVFKGSCGRTDFPTGSSSDLLNSINSLFSDLADDVEIYSGHGDKTTVGFEKKHNPYRTLLL